MAGVAGRSGKKLDSLWGDAIRRAIKRREEKDPKALERLAEVLLSKCDVGDMGAIKELGDRLDGKAPQSSDVTITHERSAGELNAAELDAAIARLGAVAREAAAAVGAREPDSVH